MAKEFAATSNIWELTRAYLIAKQSVIECGYAHEIDWQDQLSFSLLTEECFLRESAWVILSSGMRESVIRKKFPDISIAFYKWESSRKIVKKIDQCRGEALKHFNNTLKIEAIIEITKHVHENGFEFVRRRLENEGVTYISQFPFMGPATSFHLAKNVGLSFAKPDRHLNRIAETVGYNSAHTMCSDISYLVGDKISVVDLVLWRYATLFKDYTLTFPTPEDELFDLEDPNFCWLK